MKIKQSDILERVAKAHGLSTKEAEEIWLLFTEKIRETISDLDKKGEDGLYDIEKFPIIHIDNFGKFVPDKRNIRHANMCIKEKNNGKS